ncbi:alpha/beta hydrolase [Phytoactinopolyspora alkaliphila]|uniref:Alpha/beta hydrolase n=1 Tax=Phytoactinopolyspora alkaliphila TaxID=1783498 RepID=A0A6N9YIE7_9ACTN|nr:alpha/beta hydrolase [Phytoactinopolyspora alkaliphila]NED94776.1 alpha/beta hydrolase [Phytoactinopolyspora alkaliphila]
MEFLSVNDAQLAFRVTGSGPPLLAPECNYTWAPEHERMMARRFTLIVASPRDFGASTRTGGPYEPGLWASDMLAVARHLGHSRFLCFGYSFTGAFGPWLALRLADHSAVVAVASGGFPLLGDYSVTSRDVDAQMAHLEKDPGLWAEIEHRFDPRAGARFYRELSMLPPDALVDDAPCPLYCFWGDRDHDAVEMVLPSSVLAEGLNNRGVPWKQFEGYDHEGLNSHLEVAWPDTEAWLLEQAQDLGF